MHGFPRGFVRLWTIAALTTGVSGLAQVRTVPRIEAIRFWSFGDVTRIAIQTNGGYRLSHDQVDNPARAFFDLTGLEPPAYSRHGYETLQVNDRRVKSIRVAPLAGATTRIVFDLEAPAEIVYSQLVNPDRLMIEIRPKSAPVTPLVLARSTTGSQRLDEVAVAEKTPPVQTSVTAPALTQPVVSDAPRAAVPLKTEPAKTLPLKTEPSTAEPLNTEATKPQGQTTQVALNVPPPTIVTRPLETPLPKTESPVAAAPARRPSTGDTSLVRVFGLKMGKIVIDAGHGGHDTGTIGKGGLREKDLVLDVALRLGALVETKLGLQVVYTRSDDTFIPLEERTRIANQQKADLFISIHANSSPEPHATGVETYYFNFNSDKAGLDLATRENATASSSISDLNDLLHKAVLQTKLEESREFAQAMQSSLWTESVRMNTLSRNRGVRQAPFVVLIGATMPSILTEIGFVSNSHDEKLMRRPEQRQKIAEALYKGIAAYAGTLSHSQMARATATH